MKIRNMMIVLILPMLIVGCGRTEVSNLNVDGDNNVSKVSIEKKDKNDTQVQDEIQAPVENENVERETTFRNNVWGDSKDVIKKNEISLSLTEDDDLGLTYDGEKIANLEVLTSYYIDKDYGLYRGLYYVTEKHTNENSYVDDYYALQKALVLKYGEANEEELVWMDDLYKDDPNNYGMAVITGGLGFYTRWEVGNTEIMLVLQGDNYSPELVIGYTDLNYEFKDNVDGL